MLAFTSGKLIGLIILLFGLSLGPEMALADDPTTAELATAINTMWTLLAAFLVFLMHAGFTMVESGFTRSKNTVNIVMKNFMTVALGVVIFFIVGFGLAFGADKGGFLGTTGFWLAQTEGMDFGIPLLAFWFFQAVFCATSATIVSGAMAERTRLMSYLVFTVIITAFIYPVVAHWVWGGGWLQKRGFIDFAGSTVVHSVGGWSALIGAALVGPRLGKYGPQGEVHPIPGHNIPMGALGTLLLWFGWFGFNPGSTLSGTTPAIASIATTTLLAASAAAIASMVFSWARYGKSDLSLTLNGALGGLVAITAGTAVVSPTGSLIIGMVAGLVLVLAVEFFDRVLKVDDPVGAVSVHLVCGALGTIMVGLFATEGGLFYGGGAALLLTQLIGVVSVGVWTSVLAFISFKLIDIIFCLRVPKEEEIEGLDLGEHGMQAYNFKLATEVIAGEEAEGLLQAGQARRPVGQGA
ncbi:MAG: ammonium transporter, Amt family [Clostridia bacterium]|nr:ammonium transporter, Amt family [Clostridia bacterium]